MCDTAGASASEDGGGVDPPSVAVLRFSIRLPSAPISVSVARAALTAIALGTHPDLLETAKLVLSELVTNAIRHGSPSRDDPIEVDIEADDVSLSVEVRDRGPAFDLPTALPSPDQVGGFGLRIAGIASDLTVRHVGNGNVVTFALPRLTTGMPR